MVQEAQLSKSLFDEDCKFSDLDSGLQIPNSNGIVMELCKRKLSVVCGTQTTE
jgi:nicotinate-nucleotide pyrophosphorylase